MANKKKPNKVQSMIERLIEQPYSPKLRDKINEYIRNTTVFKKVITETGNQSAAGRASFTFHKGTHVDNLFCNVVTLDQLFHKKNIVEDVINHKLEKQQIVEEIDALKKELDLRFTIYAFWVDRVDALKQLLLNETKYDFTSSKLDEILTPKTGHSKSDGSKLTYGLRAIQNLEQLEEKGKLTKSSTEYLIEKAQTYLRLGALDLAQENAKEVLKIDEKNSDAWFVRILVLLIKRKSTLKELNRLYHMTEGVVTPLTSEEHSASENLADNASEYEKIQDNLNAILAKAISYWPQENKHTYRDHDKWIFSKNLFIESIYERFKIYGEPSFEIMNKNDLSSRIDNFEQKALNIIYEYHERHIHSENLFYNIFSDEYLTVDLKLLHIKYLTSNHGYDTHRNEYFRKLNQTHFRPIEKSILSNSKLSPVFIYHQENSNSNITSINFIEKWMEDKSKNVDAETKAIALMYLLELYKQSFENQDFMNCIDVANSALKLVADENAKLIHSSWINYQPAIAHQELWNYLKITAATNHVLKNHGVSNYLIRVILEIKNPSKYFAKEELYCEHFDDDLLGEYFEPFFGASIFTSGKFFDALEIISQLDKVSDTDKQLARVIQNDIVNFADAN